MGTCSRTSAFLMRKSICSRPSLYSRPGHARAREGKPSCCLLMTPNTEWTGPLTTPTKEALTARAAELGSAALILMGFFVEPKRTVQREGGGKLQRISIHIQLGYLGGGRHLASTPFRAAGA